MRYCDQCEEELATYWMATDDIVLCATCFDRAQKIRIANEKANNVPTVPTTTKA